MLLTFSLKYGKNDNLVISPSELLDKYFFGLSICTKDGKLFSLDKIAEYIRSAQTKVENTLMIKLLPQVLSEEKDFIRGDWKSWGFLKTSYPVKKVCSLTGFINQIKQVEYPIEWVSVNTPSEENLLLRTVHIVPAGNNAPVNNSVVYVGISPHLGFAGMNNIPNYWKIKYITGFFQIPDDILHLIGRIASIPIFAVLGDILLGAGIASQSLSIDGLSQSIATTQSAENSAYSARIRQYAEEIKKELPQMISFYKGLTFSVM